MVEQHIESLLANASTYKSNTFFVAEPCTLAVLVGIQTLAGNMGILIFLTHSWTNEPITSSTTSRESVYSKVDTTIKRVYSGWVLFDLMTHIIGPKSNASVVGLC